MTTVHVLNNLSTYTKVPYKIVEALTEKTELCIGSAINDAKIAGESVIIIDIGIGTLSIDLVDMQCKFIPSKNLKAVIKQAAVDGIDPVQLALEKEFTTKLMAICQEVL